MLNYLIRERIEIGDIKELERISFVFKVDLAIGIRIIPPGSRPLFVRLNRIRNKLAHNFLARVTRQDCSGLSAMVPGDLWREKISHWGNTPTAEVRTAFFWAWGLLAAAVANHRDEQVRRKASQPIIDAAMAVIEGMKAKGYDPDRFLPPGIRDPEEIVKEEREKRKRDGYF
jgi:hypothetical protein